MLKWGLIPLGNSRTQNCLMWETRKMGYLLLPLTYSVSRAIPNDLTSRTLSGSPKANGNHETKNQTGVWSWRHIWEWWFPRIEEKASRPPVNKGLVAVHALLEVCHFNFFQKNEINLQTVWLKWHCTWNQNFIDLIIIMLANLLLITLYL